MNYNGPLFLPRTGSIFRLKEDFVTPVYLRGNSYSAVSHQTKADMLKYGVKPVGSATGDLWLIPAGNKFTLFVKQNKYNLEFTKVLNPTGVYNIIVGDWRANIEIPSVEFIS